MPAAANTFGDLNLEATQTALLAELSQKLEPGQSVVVSSVGGTVTVGGTVALDAATLAALEAIDVRQSGAWTITVTDGGGSLTVDGTVALDAATLAALETVNALGPLTDAQLRAASVPVTVGNPTETGLAKDATVIHQRGKFQPGVRTTKALTVSTVGNNTVHTPAAGKKVRAYWVGLSTSQDNTVETVVVVKFGAAGAAKYRWCMGNPGAFSHWEPIEGAVDEPLVVNLSAGQNVEVNVTLEEI